LQAPTILSSVEDRSLFGEPLVHTKVTSGRKPLAACFQGHLTASMYNAWSAAESLYQAVDRENNTHYEHRLHGCRTQAWFARHIETGKVRVISSACRLRWCPLCAKAKRTYITHEVANWIEHSRYHKFVTFTLKHSEEELSFQIDRLYKCFQKLRKSVFFKKHVVRGVWFFQIKRSKQTKQWHPHLHCIVTGQWIPYNELRAAWLKITKDSSVVDIRPVKDPAGCANEVARYAAAPANLTTNAAIDYSEIWESLHGRRICGKWNMGDRVKLTPPKSEDHESWENIGTWSAVQELQNTSSQAKAIIKAWSEKTPLEAGIDMYFSDPSTLSLCELAEKYSKKDYDLTFWDDT